MPLCVSYTEWRQTVDYITKKIHPTDINASIMVMVTGSTEDMKSNYKQNVAQTAETDWNICITIV